MPAVVKITVDPTLYLRDPEGTELGRRIVSAGIQYIDDHGFDELTFKKLADAIASTEASIYRYFKSKRQLLKYLVAWYWNWLDYIISLKTTNVSGSYERLQIAMKLLITFDDSYSELTIIDTALLRRIIIAESARVYLTRQDKTINEPLFEGYHSLSERIVSIIREVNPHYQYPFALATTLITSVHKQVFYANYIPGGSGQSKIKAGSTKEIEEFLTHLVFAALQATGEPSLLAQNAQ